VSAVWHSCPCFVCILKEPDTFLRFVLFGYRQLSGLVFCDLLKGEQHQLAIQPINV